MQFLSGILFLTGAYPLLCAWRANWRTSLSHALYWATLAWVMWAPILVGRLVLGPDMDQPSTRYFALALTACAGIAVFGARRPGVMAWNLVVIGLLAVLLLPVAEGWVLQTGLHLNEFHTVTLCGTLALSIMNYLPTRLAPAAIFLAFGCAGEIVKLLAPDAYAEPPYSLVFLPGWWLILTPWVAYLAVQWRPAPPGEFDRIWMSFRDRFGFVWSQRLREQFNASALHSAWPVILRWQGMRLLPGARQPDPGVQTSMVATLYALMTRFGMKVEVLEGLARDE